jgi:hypothetical protein
MKKLSVYIPLFLLTVYMIVKQLQCIDCTEFRLFVDNWPAYIITFLATAVLFFGSDVVQYIFRNRE